MPETIIRPRAPLNNDITVDPIYLFQRRVWSIISIPEGCSYDDEGIVDDSNPEGGHLTGAELHRIDSECCLESWYTETVFLTREEGEEWGKRKAYRYPDGWRVFCVPAAGQLAEVLAQHTEGGRYA